MLPLRGVKGELSNQVGPVRGRILTEFEGIIRFLSRIIPLMPTERKRLILLSVAHMWKLVELVITQRSIMFTKLPELCWMQSDMTLRHHAGVCHAGRSPGDKGCGISMMARHPEA
jgi:hypothetical protein